MDLPPGRRDPSGPAPGGKIGGDDGKSVRTAGIQSNSVNWYFGRS
jgi:hypothetical protein